MWGFYIAFNGLVLAESRPPTGDELVAAVDEFNRTARFPLPSLDEDGQQTLCGDVLRLLERSTIPGEASRAVGLVLTDVPRNQVWVSCQDLHFAQNEKWLRRCFTVRMSMNTPGLDCWISFVADRYGGCPEQRCHGRR